MIYGIIAALDEELLPLLERTEVHESKACCGTTIYRGELEGRQAVLCKCSIGTLNAAICTNIVIREFGATAVINTGIAGALGEGVQVLDLVISKDVTRYDIDAPIYHKYYPFTTVYEANAILAGRAIKAAEALQKPDGAPVRVHHGRVLTGDHFVESSQMKRELVAKYRPLCCEMEGAAVAHAALVNDCPFLVIRAMSDCADENANESYDNLISHAGLLSARTVLGILAQDDGSAL